MVGGLQHVVSRIEGGGRSSGGKTKWRERWSSDRPGAVLSARQMTEQSTGSDDSNWHMRAVSGVHKRTIWPPTERDACFHVGRQQTM